MSRVKELYYSVLDKILLGKGIKRKINGFDVVFPTRYYKYYEPDYEHESLDFIRKTVKPGHLVLDIGGHIGLYAISFKQLVGPAGKVYTFEPTPSTNRILRKTMELNAAGSTVTVQNEAISREKGETVFYISDDLTDNSNSLVNFKKPRNVKGIKIPLTSVDVFSKMLGRKVDFLKIDVEGVELDAVLGARETLLRDRPVCILALHPMQVKSKGDTLEAIWDAVVACNYSILMHGQPVSRESFSSQQQLFDVHLLPL